MSDNAGRPESSAHVTSRRELRGALQTASRIVVDNPDLARQVATLSRGRNRICRWPRRDQRFGPDH
jgi:hypothetical protein